MGSPPARKKARLGVACSNCRKRKVRCDDRQPACSNCVRAGMSCNTVDLRHPERAAERREAGLASNSIPEPPPTPSRTEASAPDVDHASAYGEERLPALPRFKAGHGFFILTQWLDLAFRRLRLSGPLHWLHESHGRYQNLDLGDWICDPQLHDVPHYADYAAAEDFSTVHSVFQLPILYARGPSSIFLQANEDDSVLASCANSLRQACVVGCRPWEPLNTAKRAIGLTLRHLGCITIRASPLSVQILALLSLQLRSIDQGDLAWRIVSSAVSMAYTLELHRQSTIGKDSQRIWWCVYALERTLSLELERPSNIRDAECDLQMPTDESHDHETGNLPLFCAAVRLARIHGHVMEHFLSNRTAEEGSASRKTVICEKLRAIGKLDEMLRQWADGLPDGLRPDNYMDCDPSMLPGVAYLALQYYSTEFLLHRHALIVERAPLRAVVAQSFADDSFRHRILNGHSICTNSTRKIVNIISHLHEYEAPNILNTLRPSIIATYGLAVQIISKPSAVTTRSDAELQGIAISLIRRHDDMMHSFKMADEHDMSARAHILQKLSDFLAPYVHNGRPAASTSISGERASHSAQTLRHSSNANTLYSPNPVGDDVSGYGAGTDMTGWTPSLFGDDAIMNEFDWASFAEAFPLG